MDREYGEIRQAFVYDPSLVLYLPLYELDKVSFMSKDAYGHPGTVTGAVWSPSGRYFDGVDDSIDCGDAYTRMPGAFTFECWYKHVAGDWKAFWTMGSPYPLMRVVEGSQLIDLEMGGSNLRDWTPVAIYDGAWHHLAMSIPGNGINDIDDAVLYADGQVQKVNSTTKTGAQNAKNKLYLGRLVGYAQWLKGYLSEVRFYSRVLTPLEIQQNYLATKWRYR